MSTSRQALRFLVSGVIATLADAGTYAFFLATHLTEDAGVAKGCSFVVGTTVAYLLAKAWTFAGTPQRQGQGLAFLALYGAALVVNVVSHELLLAALGGHGPLTTPVAFCGATGCSMVLNFVGQKTFVFRAPEA